MEQLGIQTNFLLFHILNFIVMLVLLNMFLYQPITDLFERRRERIREGLAEAERVREQAAEERSALEAQLNEERRTSQERLREAVARSEEAAKRRLEEANQEADQIVAKARTEAQEIRQQALAGLQSEIADLTVRAASKVLNEEIDRRKHSELIDRFLEREMGALK